MKMEFTDMNPLRVFTAFSGYDSQCLALKRLGIPYELVGWSEIDRYAIRAHDALFPEWAGRNFGDISKIDWGGVPDFDLFTMSSPCQDFSMAGLRKGGAEGSGTRSSLLWECRSAILAKRPRYVLFENVKALVSKKFLPYFNKWQDELSSYGYSNFAKVLNARDYGVPQNRERIFMVSILDFDGIYHFPKAFPLGKRLKDVLDVDVDESYYLSRKMVDYVFSNGGKNGGIQGATGVHGKDDPYANVVTAQYWKCPRTGNYIKESVGCAIRGREAACLTPRRNEYGKQVRKAYESGRLKESRHNMQRLEMRTDGVCNTITSVQKDCLIAEPGRIGYTCGDSVKVVGNIYDGGKQGGRIYDKNGISPCLGANSGGNLQPKIIVRNRQDAAPVGISANPDRKFEYGDGRIYTDISPCITTQEAKHTSYVYQTDAVYFKGKKYNYGDGLYFKASSKFNRGGMPGLSRTLKAESDNGVCDVFGIRRLTPREAFRLMDVDDSDIDRIQAAGISNTQQYTLAGNSIVVNVLFHIFRKLFADKGNEERQLTLF